MGVGGITFQFLRILVCHNVDTPRFYLLEVMIQSGSRAGRNNYR